MNKLVIICCLVSLVGLTRGELLSLDFRGNGGAFDFNATTGTVTTNGLTMEFTANDPEDSGAVLNAASYYGVNSNDDSDSDTVEIGQSISITFTSGSYTSIMLEDLTVGAWSSGDGAFYQIDSDPFVTITNSGTHSVATDVLGKTLVFETTGGNGISLNGITVDTIPEPASVGFLIAGSIMCLLGRKKLRI